MVVGLKLLQRAGVVVANFLTFCLCPEHLGLDFYTKNPKVWAGWVMLAVVGGVFALGV